MAKNIWRRSPGQNKTFPAYKNFVRNLNGNKGRQDLVVGDFFEYVAPTPPATGVNLRTLRGFGT